MPSYLHNIVQYIAKNCTLFCFLQHFETYCQNIEKCGKNTQVFDEKSRFNGEYVIFFIYSMGQVWRENTGRIWPPVNQPVERCFF